MQLNFDLFANTMQPASGAALAAVEVLASQGGVEARGAVFTRREVVDFILDLAGYTPDKPLHVKRLLEPSFGGGDFLLPAVERLLAAWRIHGDGGSMFDALKNAIRAVELHRDTFQSTRRALVEYMTASDVGLQTANRLADAWLVQDDFLLVHLEGQFDYVVGNPPYVRQELIPEALMREYRARYSTIYDRADLYIPFIEHSLCMLAPGGALGFICADRWMKNRYGAPLRKLVAEQFHLKVYVDMDGIDAFHQEVSAYPAITVICREPSGPTRIGHCPEISVVSLAKLAALLDFSLPLVDCAEVREMQDVAAGESPWLIESSDQLALLRRLEKEFPLLEEVGCKVGIGVATGADKVFIGDYAALDVEPECKLPLVTTRDIQSGEMQWRGLGVINPFGNEDGLVDLTAYPRLRRYLELHKAQILQRHCAQKNPTGWYRTIDRIFPALCNKPKLLIPDIKGEAHIVYEAGEFYPHHNLYFVTSDTWDLRALQAVLLSSISRLFVAIYSTKMRGGFMRFQAQYLRRIRLPQWSDVPETLREELRDAAIRRDLDACNRAVFSLYGLSLDERAALGGNGA
jgi:hypothetical protein